MEGWIKLHRRILDNPLLCKDSDYFSIWNYLLLNATHKERKAIFKGESIMLKKGELITGRKSISRQFNINESKVQRVLKNLEIEQQIEQRTGNQNRLISIVNWTCYQEDEQQTEQRVNNERTTSEQRVNTNKNERMEEGKNERNIIEFSDEFLEAWELYNKKIGRLGSQSVGFDNFNIAVKEFSLDQIKTAINDYCIDSKNTEDRFLKTGANFFEIEYIRQHIKPIKSTEVNPYKGMTLTEEHKARKAEAEARGERYGE